MHIHLTHITNQDDRETLCRYQQSDQADCTGRERPGYEPSQGLPAYNFFPLIDTFQSRLECIYQWKKVICWKALGWFITRALPTSTVSLVRLLISTERFSVVLIRYMCQMDMHLRVLTEIGQSSCIQ